MVDVNNNSSRMAGRYFMNTFEIADSALQMSVMLHGPVREMLKIEMRDTATNKLWVADYTKEYIEELTKRTGSFKTFSTFVSMLESLMSKKFDELSMNFVSYNDLEALRMAKVRNNVGAFHLTSPKDVSRTDKRYLIISYSTNFDRVQYPLPMQYMGFVDVNTLCNTIHELRSQMHGGAYFEWNAQDFAEELNNLRQMIASKERENITLRKQVVQVQSVLAKFASQGDLDDDDLTQITNTIDDQDSVLQQNLARSRSENRRMRVELEALDQQNRQMSARISQLKHSLCEGSRERPSRDRTPRRLSRSNSVNDTLSRRVRRILQDENDRFCDPSGERPTRRKRIHSAEQVRDRSSSRGHEKFDPTAYVRGMQAKRKEVERKKEASIRKRFSSGASNGGLSRCSETRLDRVRDRASPSPIPRGDRHTDDLGSKIRRFFRSQERDQAPTNGKSLPQRIAPSKKGNSTDIVMDDIDKRLDFLQNFLKRYLKT